MTRSTKHTIAAAVVVFLVAASTGTFASPEGHGFMGVSLARLDQVEGAADGLYISRVHEETGAARAGLKEHDRIVSINGKPVSEHADVQRVVLSRKPGDVVEVVVSRAGERKTFDVTLGEPPRRTEAPHKGPMYVRELRDGGRPMMGVHAITLTPQLAGFYEVGGGALVTDVVEDGPAWRAGIRAGDVVFRWNGEDVSGMEEIFSHLGRAKAGDTAEIEVIRRDSVQQFDVELAEREEVERRAYELQLSEENDPKLELIEKGADKKDK